MGTPENIGQTSAQIALPRSFIYAAFAILLADRIAFHLLASPIPDEAYYWLWGQHIDWSYHDHPPFQAWMQGLFTSVFSSSRFALRLPAILTSAVLIWSILWWVKKAASFGMEIRRDVALLVVFSSPLFFIFTSMVFNDHLLIALLSLAIIAGFQTLDTVAQTGRVPLKPLYATAILLGLAGLTKYNAVLIAAGIFATALLLPRFRSVFRSPHFYLATLAGIVCVLPVAIWNIDNAGASFQFHLGERLGDQRSLKDAILKFIGFLLASSVALSPFLLFPLFRMLKTRRTLAQSHATWRMLTIGILATSVAAVLVLSYYINVLYYWGIVAYIAFLPLAAYYFAKRWHLISHVIFGLILNTIFAFNYTALPVNALFGGYDSEFAVLYGWPEIAEAATEAQANNNADFLATTDYRTGAILAFWSGDNKVEVIANRNSQFNYWFDPALRSGQSAVLLSDRAYPLIPFQSDRFRKIELLRRVEIKRFGFPVNVYSLYLASDFGQ